MITSTTKTGDQMDLDHKPQFPKPWLRENLSFAVVIVSLKV